MGRHVNKRDIAAKCERNRELTAGALNDRRREEHVGQMREG